MPTTSQLIRLSGGLVPPDTTALADTELLRRYAADRDEPAFAELVRRNGPLVLRACRHVLGEAAADDAFQATFLLLVRSAGRLTGPGSLAGWLHATAVRVAQAARRGEDRRRRREAAHRPPPTNSDDMTWREVREILDAEIAALPECYRLPLVLCHVRELGYEEAARQAGCSVGALRGRLERGKARLRARLARYGLPLAAPALVGGCPPPASAALVERAVAVVRAGASGVVPPRLAALLRPAGRPRATTLLTPVAVVVVVVGAVLAAGADPVRPTGAPAVADVLVVAAPTPAVDRLGDPLPAGAVARLGTNRLFGPFKPRWAAFSPDGAKVAVLGDNAVTVCDAATGRLLAGREQYWPVGRAISWRADGTGVAVVPLADQSHFISVFTDPDEKLPVSIGNWNPGIAFLTFSPNATRLAAVRDPNEKQFTIDILPATAGRRVSELVPLRTLGPFAGPCQEVRYTARGVLVLTGVRDGEGDWTVSLIDPDRNAVARTVAIPHPAYSKWGFMYSLSADARLAAVPLRPKTDAAGKSTTGRSTTGHDGTVRVWDLDAGTELRSVPFPEKASGTGHAFSPDGKTLVVSGQMPDFQVWDVATGKEVARAPRPATSFPDWDASAVAVSPDGKRFATARQGGRIDLWDTATARPVIPLDTHRKAITTVAVSPDSRLAATLGEDAAVRVWDVATGTPVCTIAAPGVGPDRPTLRPRPAFTPDGRGLLFTSGGELMLADPVTGKAMELPGALRGCRDVVGGFSADGKTLATFAADAVSLRDWPAGGVRVSIPVKRPETTGANYAATMSPDGWFLFASTIGNSTDPPLLGSQTNLDVWDARAGKHLHRLERLNAAVRSAGFSPDARVLYVGGHGMNWSAHGRTRADALTAWNPAAGKLLRRLVEPDRPAPPDNGNDAGRDVRALAVSPDGRLVATAEDVSWSFDGVWVYEAVSGRPLKKFVGHVGGNRRVNDLAFTPDGRRLISVSDDQTGLVWDMTLPALASRPPGTPGAKDLAAIWDQLAGADPASAYRGVAALAASPASAIALLKEKLRPCPVPTEAELDALTARLGSSDFAEREKASADLDRLGPNAVAGVRARFGTAGSPEVRDRLTRFLAAHGSPRASAYELRCVRGVAALEAIGTPAARGVLTDLSRGSPTDPLTREAVAALRRVEGR